MAPCRFRPTLVLAFALIACASLAAAQAGADKDKPEIPTVGPRELVIQGDPVRIILPVDGIASVDSPEFLSAAEADAVYSDDEPILGVVVDGDARAYSLWHLDRHEIVNDVVGGQPLAATW
jgi:hypothetical protein